MKQSKEEHSVGLNFVWPMRKPTTHRVLVAAADGFLGVLFVQQKTERKGEKNFHHLQNQPRSQFAVREEEEQDLRSTRRGRTRPSRYAKDFGTCPLILSVAVRDYVLNWSPRRAFQELWEALEG
ncbi:hypothetical protein E3N88_44695 [Mikania micrantha]|uniref:Uncharacterized protein n=1 Tax=Mikania micrantha TaxID=192012 RepID=A0A5N6LBA4_9ASTR|nr:hypothetical protein E3N88_44695 [Mikania micrantha]